MGWWSTTIMGGDTPLDYQGELTDIISGGYLTRRNDITAAQLENMDEVFVNGKIESLVKYKDCRSIMYQVLMVMAMRVGAKISSKLKLLAISNIRNDEWQFEDSSRKEAIDNLIQTLNQYDGSIRVTVKSEGLFEVFNKHQADGKPGLINK
tara:strand:- start:456 stop:908 length:453 start_codon:yes stop_codon:yes gene_type:complete